MAQQDTGLGWSAKEEWLTPQTAYIGQTGGGLDMPTGYRTIPEFGWLVPSDWRQLVNAGFNGWTDSDNNKNFIGVEPLVFDTYEIYVVSYTVNNNTYIDAVSPREFGLLRLYQQISETTGDYFRTLWYSPGGRYGAITANGFYRLNLIVSDAYSYWGYVSWQDIYNIGTFSSTDAAMDAITAAFVDWYKLRGGFAVRGLSQWIDAGGVEHSSAFCISTNYQNTILSNDGTTESQNYETLTFLYDGITFYMSIGSVDNTLIGTPAEGVPSVNLVPFSVFNLAKMFNTLASSSFANIVVITSPDPYQEGDGSEPAGGDGEEDTEDDVEHTDPPSTSIGATGFITIFTPTLSELQNLASFMWSAFDVDNWRKLFANPMDAILGLHIIPVPAYVSGSKTVKVGGISTEISMSYTSIRYLRRSMGTCEIPPKWNAYLDYSPYTRFSIYLPYIGFREIDADDIMGKTLDLQYMIDILSGACVAELMCGDTVLYVWEGNCANQVPITGTSWNSAIASALGIAGSVAVTALSGGASAPMVAGTIASVGANSMNLKPTLNRSGSISGSGGFMANQRPYIIRNQPNLTIPADQNKFIGYPSFVTVNLANLTGYNEISSIHLENIPATQTELNEIETLLEGGVIF